MGCSLRASRDLRRGVGAATISLHKAEWHVTAAAQQVARRQGTNAPLIGTVVTWYRS